MGELIAKTTLKRESGFLYYVKAFDNAGNLGIFKAKLARGGRVGRTSKAKK
ncbi:MAG TPA: hypothetical protein VMV86_06560 [Methanosarcinales archaeon]|nr:hypothetical protein [Methanosarcinales archaeon]